MNKYKYDGDGDNIRHSHSPKQTAWRVVLILAAVVSYIVGVTCTAISNIPSISEWCLSKKFTFMYFRQTHLLPNHENE